MKTVLIVDDDDVQRDSVLHALESAGFTAVSASSGRQALEVLAHAAIDLVVLALGMPSKSGVATYAAMAKDTRLASIPVIPTSSVPPSGTPAATRVGLQQLLRAVERNLARV